jgi:very-short-patch-repair endonuclease
MGDRNRGIYSRPLQKTRRTELRHSLTPTEIILWRKLQNRQILNKKFRRQSGIGPYIVDFYCPDCTLVVELDGAHHFGFLRPEYDEHRTRFLERLGLKVIRFENKQVFRELEYVLQSIEDAILAFNR